jgi:hypothetical protein
MSSCYVSVKQSRTGLPVPVFADGRSMHSLYDPVHEADQIVSSFSTSASFFILAGSGAGYTASALLKKFPRCAVLAVEKSEDDIRFLETIPLVGALASAGRVSYASVSDFTEKFISDYVPSVYGSIQFMENRTWVTENPSDAERLHELFTSALESVSADYSVQAHFGRIWQRNILVNLSFLTGTASSSCFHAPEGKTALIAAAGPTLDASYSSILSHRERYFIIATDTAYSSFIKRGIHCDAVVSIDGQAVSRVHFIDSRSCGSTLFIFDLCADPAAVRTVASRGGSVLFIHTGHPFSRYASSYAVQHDGAGFPLICSGSGTVTIAAADFAVKAGFRTICSAGADFAYVTGKPYMKGTYLDMLYNSESRRFLPAETVFDSLMYRTPLIPCGSGRYTTTVLDSYRLSLESFLASSGVSCVSDGDIKSYDVCSSRSAGIAWIKSFDFNGFADAFKAGFGKAASSEIDPLNLSPEMTAVLPLVAYIRSHAAAGSCRSFSELAKLAYSGIVRYT